MAILVAQLCAPVDDIGVAMEDVEGWGFSLRFEDGQELSTAFAHVGTQEDVQALVKTHDGDDVSMLLDVMHRSEDECVTDLHERVVNDLDVAMLINDLSYDKVNIKEAYGRMGVE